MSATRPVDLNHYTPGHRLELERLATSQEWQEVMRSGLVEEVRAERIQPRKTRDYIGTVVSQLLDFNAERVKGLMRQGCQEEGRLLSELSRWPESLEGRDPVISFLGLNVTAKCNFDPKCAYCNQPCVEPRMDLGAWKGVIEEATARVQGEGPYVYITGGEPLTLGEDIWGDRGLVRFATERGAGVNVNTNAAMISPGVALRLIKAGLARLHVSLDTSDRKVQNCLFGGDRFDEVLTGIYNVQLARDIVSAPYPVIHTNCVLTNKNLDLFAQLFAFILDKHKQTADRNDPFYNDLFPHVIPVGGSGNQWLRPSEEQFRRFYEEIWPQVCRKWDRYQEELGVPQEERGALFGYFSNPFLRVEHGGGLEAYVRASAEGLYAKLALARRCYVAPTQAVITSDGFQYRCGSHAIRGVLPIGNIRDRGVFDNIKEAIPSLDELPNEHCYGCALATLYINQATESRLKQHLKQLMSPGPAAELNPSDEGIDDLRLSPTQTD